MKQVDNRIAKLDNRSKEEIADRRAMALRLADMEYKTVYCPNCGSGDVRITRSVAVTDITRKRHHKCNVCQREFDSYETIPIVDRKSTDKDALSL